MQYNPLSWYFDNVRILLRLSKTVILRYFSESSSLQAFIYIVPLIQMRTFRCEKNISETHNSAHTYRQGSNVCARPSLQTIPISKKKGGMRDQIKVYNSREDCWHAWHHASVCVFERLVSTLKLPASIIDLHPLVSARVAQSYELIICGLHERQNKGFMGTERKCKAQCLLRINICCLLSTDKTGDASGTD